MTDSEKLAVISQNYVNVLKVNHEKINKLKSYLVSFSNLQKTKVGIKNDLLILYDENSNSWTWNSLDNLI